LNPADVVNDQLRAYNARDISAFAAMYAEDVCIYRMPHAQIGIRGKAQLIEIYRDRVFQREGLKAEVISRAVMGNKVIDHERTWGIKPEPVESAVVYEVESNLITSVWFFEVSGLSAPPLETPDVT
jgi:hypothetical protein